MQYSIVNFDLNFKDVLAEHIKNITDRALFERLANDILRHKFPELDNLIAGGINERGETIKGKLDAFTEASPKHYALVEHTTNDSNLEGKWLYDTVNYRGKKQKPDQSDGDLIKAIRHADEIRETVTDAKFTIYLTCNNHVDTELWSKVVLRAASSDVSVKLLELSNIQDFLNNDPRGQYLRKQHLGIDYELLSRKVLSEIQGENLSEYGRDSFIDPDAIEGTERLNELQDFIDRSSKDLLFIIAESGLGKSTLCFSFIQQKQSDHHVFRVTPQMVNDSRDPSHLVHNYVCYYRPSIFWNTDAENVAFETPTYVIVDDLNNFGNPLRVLDKMISWSSISISIRRQIKFICPIWPQYFEQIPNRGKKEEAYDTFHLRRPNRRLAAQMLIKNLNQSTVTLTPLQQEEVIKDTNYDPLLIGLYAALIRKHGFFTISQGSAVIKNFVDDKLNEVSSFLAITKFRLRALTGKIGEYMFTQKKIEPHFKNLEVWLQGFSDGLNILEKLGVDRNLFVIKQTGVLRFRHDRIRDYFLVEGIKQLLPDMITNSNSFTDPFFIRQISMAISQERITGEQIDFLLKTNPETIFYTLRYLQADQQSEYFDLFVTKISDWKNSPDFTEHEKSTINGIIWDLLDSDTRKIELITSKLPQDRILFLAQLRNGDVTGGIKYFAIFSKDFEPYFGNQLRDSVINHVRANHPQVQENLKKVLDDNKLSTTGKKGAYLLAGYLSNESLTVSILNNWNESTDNELYPYFIWGILHCFSPSQRTELKVALDYSNNLLDEGYEESGYPKGVKNVMLHVFCTIRWRLNDSQIVLLDEFYEDYPQLIKAIFGHFDHPLAILRTVEEMGDGLERAHPQSIYATIHPDDRWSFKRNGYRLSATSLDCLQNIWSDTSRPEKQRKVALRFWTDNLSTKAAIPALRKLPLDDSKFSKTMIWRRALLGDQHVTTLFLNSLRDNPHWVSIIHNIWNDECKQAYQKLLDQHPNGYLHLDTIDTFAEVLRNIPKGDGEELLLKNWQRFKENDAWVQTALYIAEERTLALAKDVVKASKDPAQLFRYINNRFGCFETQKEKKLTLDKFQALEPYLKYFEPFTLKEFAEQCLRSNFQQWLYDVLIPHLPSESQRYFRPDVSDLIEEINRESNINNPVAGQYWLESLRQRNVTLAAALIALEQWSKEFPSAQGLKFLTNCLDEIGTRKDLRLLDDYNFNDENSESIKKSTHYLINKRTLD